MKPSLYCSRLARRSHPDPPGWVESVCARAIAKHGPVPELTEDERAFLEMPNEFDDERLDAMVIRRFAGLSGDALDRGGKRRCIRL